jgi:hypothetical protein
MSQENSQEYFSEIGRDMTARCKLKNRIDERFEKTVAQAGLLRQIRDVLKAIMRRLKADQNPAEEGYEDLLRALDRKPFPSVEGLRNAQRLMKVRNPKLAELKVENIIDERIMRKLEGNGFINSVYAAQGLK